MRTLRGLQMLCVAGLVGLSATSALAQATPAHMTSAANAFLATLDAKQRQGVLFSYDDRQQRQRWSNFPTGIVQRAGIKLGDMTEPQRAALLKLLSATLSTKGYQKVQEIMDGDEVNKTTDQGPRGRGGPPGGAGRRGGPPPGGGPGPGGGAPSLLFGKDLYYVSFLSTPSDKAPWMLQFGGHHLAMNITVDARDGVLTPTLTGAQPALYTLNGKTVRPLGGENDKAAALFNSLTPQQRSQAVLGSNVADLVLGPGQDGKTIMPEGLKATAMTEAQRAALLDLVAEWTGILQDDLATARMAEIKAGLNETWFAWSGATTVTPGTNFTSYYRIQGPHLVIEFAPQGGDAQHIHTMYRDPTNDYGAKFTRK